MKELKFRVWDKEQKEFLKYCVLENDGTIMQPTMANGLDFSPLDPNRYEITQSTGLKDRKGQEIYEGDIVGISEYTKHPTIYEIQFDEETASFILVDFITDTKVRIETTDNLKEAVIVDNIYKKLKL